jgi:hypothetical protein
VSEARSAYRDGAVAEDRERQQRLRRPALDDDEPRQQCDRDDGRADQHGGSEARLGELRDHEHEQQQTTGAAQRPGHVGPAPVPLA